MEERGYKSRDPRINKNNKRNYCSTWDYNFEPQNNRFRYNQNSTNNHFHHKHKRYYNYQPTFHKRNYNPGFHNNDFAGSSGFKRNDQQVLEEKNKYVENNNNLDFNYETSRERYKNNLNVEHDHFSSSSLSLTETNPKIQNPEQIFENSQYYCEQNEELNIIQLSITRNLSIQDPRTKISCYHCKSRVPIYLKVIEKKMYYQNSQKNTSPSQSYDLKEIDQNNDENNEVKNDSKNKQESDFKSTPKINSRRMSMSIKKAIEDENVKKFLEQLDQYRLKHKIQLFSVDTKNMSSLKLLNLNSLNNHFHFCDPFLDLDKFIEALGEATKKHGAICKVGSTEAKLVEDKSTGYIKIYVQRKYRDLELSDIFAVYTYDVNYRNHCERVAIHCGRGLSGTCNDKNDIGEVKIKNQKHARLLYVIPINKSKELSVKDILRSNSNENNYIHIVTHFLLEMSNIESTFCGECDKVCKNKHSHTGTPDVYRTGDKIDLKDINTLVRSDRKKVEEINLVIHGGARLSTVFDRYREKILDWTKYFKNNFLGCKFKISSHEPYFKISSYAMWYQNKHNEIEIKTLKKILKDVYNPSTHRFVCTLIKECKFETSNREDAEKHMKENHFTELTIDELTRIVLQSIENKH